MKFIKNKYLIAGLVFATWMLFFDRNELPLQWRKHQELSELEKSEKEMNAKIAATREELKMLKTNPSTLEKYAREKFMMKKENEDLFVIVPATENGN